MTGHEGANEDRSAASPATQPRESTTAPPRESTTAPPRESTTAPPREATTAPPREATEDALRAGLDPEALFGGVALLDQQQTVQWLGHVQRLASTGLLAGGMAHDLAGLLQPLLGECDRGLLDEDPASHRESLVRMREWARRAEGYVRALLNLVRRDEHHFAAVPVEAVVEDTLGLLRSSNRLSGVSITRCLDNCHIGHVDRTRLMQAVLNLVTNAVRAASQGGREVRVGVRGWRGWILVEVEDNGPGVPPSIAERVFEPFVHGRPEGTPPGAADGQPEQERAAHRGTGLGLYITKRLIEEQGGHIDFETEPGVGTTFRLMLKPAPVDGASAPPSGTAAPGTSGIGEDSQ